MPKKNKPNMAEMDMNLDDLFQDQAPADITEDDLPKRVVGVYVKVDAEARQEMREWCVRHNRGMRDILEAGFTALKARHGP